MNIGFIGVGKMGVHMARHILDAGYSLYVNDMNKEENGTDVVVASALWHMESAIGHAVELVKTGKFKADDYKEWTMMAKGGASLSPYYEFEAKLTPEIKDQVAKSAAAIKDGSFVVEINDDEPKSTF